MKGVSANPGGKPRIKPLETSLESLQNEQQVDYQSVKDNSALANIICNDVSPKSVVKKTQLDNESKES